MYSFSDRSKKNLNTCHESLISICHEVIKEVNFTVISGHRTEEEQNELYKRGHSNLKYPHSKHNKQPSLAVDIAPWIPEEGIPWSDRVSFSYLAGRMMGEAQRHGAKLRWGGDWDKDGYVVHQDMGESFFDAGHFELVEGSG